MKFALDEDPGVSFLKWMGIGSLLLAIAVGAFVFLV